jgi:hypothetical protein
MLPLTFFSQYSKFKHASITTVLEEAIYALEKSVSGRNNVHVGSGSIIHSYSGVLIRIAPVDPDPHEEGKNYPKRRTKS